LKIVNEEDVLALVLLELRVPARGRLREPCALMDLCQMTG
jgi:hypothetical protein